MTWTIPPETQISFKRSAVRKIAVWAIQRNLNEIDSYGLLEDGVYGGRTVRKVKLYQEEWGLEVDGIFGDHSSLRMAEILGIRMKVPLPAGLVMGFVMGESSADVGAVNWKSPGGVDCSYLMRRALDGADDATIERAFDGRYQFDLMGRTTRNRYKTFLDRVEMHSPQIRYIAGGRERSWRLAALAHNWPWAADRLSRGYSLSDDLAHWVPDTVTFKDGTPVETYVQWAKFYALGAPEHQHKGLVTQFVDDWTP